MKQFLDAVDRLEFPDLPYPHRHSDRSLIKLFLYGLTRGITGFNTLHRHLQERPDVLELAGLSVSPSQDDTK